jgi:hypothetical protein
MRAEQQDSSLLIASRSPSKMFNAWWLQLTPTSLLFHACACPSPWLPVSSRSAAGSHPTQGLLILLTTLAGPAKPRRDGSRWCSVSAASVLGLTGWALYRREPQCIDTGGVCGNRRRVVFPFCAAVLATPWLQRPSPAGAVLFKSG